MDTQIIDTPSAVKTLLGSLEGCEDGLMELYIDLEGNNLSRHGTLALLTLLVEPRHTVHLIDVTTLQGKAFATESSDGRTLKNILEAKDIIKVFFDIRNDSDALFAHYGVHVDGIEDIQLMELATRGYSKRCVNGLAKCIEADARISYTDKCEWQKVKDNGRRLFDPARGGSYGVFDERPLSADVKEYCAQDVLFMPGLRTGYRAKLCDAWWRKIEAETAARIALSHSAGYNGKGRHMALGPPHWLNWSPTSEERRTRTLFEQKTEEQSKPVGTYASSSKIDTQSTVSPSPNDRATGTQPASVQPETGHVDSASGTPSGIHVSSTLSPMPFWLYPYATTTTATLKTTRLMEAAGPMTTGIVTNQIMTKT